MILYPKAYLENVTKINVEFLNKNNIKALILDVDNTLIDYYKNLLNGIEEWTINMKQQGIYLHILSNSNHEEKVKKVADTLQIPYLYFAKKPFKKGFYTIQKKLNLPTQQIAVVGDQIFTDIIGANRCNMYSILVKPIQEKDILVTKLKRPIENYIIKRYEKKEENKSVHK